MFLGNTDKVYILDKAEGNAAQVNGHPAWGSVWYVLPINSFLRLNSAPICTGILPLTKRKSWI